jgi:hypothetical protein
MTDLKNLTVTQLRAAIAIKEKIEALEAEIASLAGGDSHVKAKRATNATALPKKRRKMSAKGRARMAAAAKARWAKAKASGRNRL